MAVENDPYEAGKDGENGGSADAAGREPCVDCRCPADHHQPVCVAIIGANDGRRYCGCIAYRAPAAPSLRR